MTDDGPISEATAEVAAWLTGTVGDTVPVGPPRPDADPGRLTLWPLEIRPARQTRGTGSGPEPYRFTVRYLLAAGGPESLATLDRVLVAATAADGRTLVLEAGDPALWAAFGTPPRPAVLIDVPVQITPSTRPAPPVLRPLRLRQLEMVSLDGRVVGPAEQPLASMRVEVVGQPNATRTDSAGRFRLVGVPHDPDRPAPVRLRLTGRGQVLTAEVDPAEPDIVIVCAPPTP
ncbi:carboxypeptidase regulatory-like domain-containing protein [Verrucosispora sp. WMMA2121]|uniref:carboxypeptidase regulatory-like domain-containing protein n=1 Tax=Verrucosispora sp. WMMA2121 TaxID=3015164 RepID=UPI0022B61479|nr:carboxypeptidase regulatory-like domain-containing protein [Verrucosispora sp. WMMA2121]MCZ7422296.1 carboxypeptidase regulatory-like domain-containing protein [Verrucosispora sp. WMMA2121]